ncbi:ubiquitin conjugation factor E4 [Plasmodium cynomolgi strain B]|uniref:RING-type E3 ubiquitin transferase n=1 Tax=Plasmodium cynomolgi (strain B) TaxID=1120755 RepID=K6UQI5_PLACD|nr:ubiquitin conjugation factor E4 [Plasmodium cynomolgi strain B]GAB65129.1 ubiquitin conjugation factor E4 [Plasmodium cynomolgi strain B]
MLDKGKEDAILQSALQICLRREEASNAKVYLESYEKELNETNTEKKPPFLQIENLYFILLHKIAYLHKQKKNCLTYLCSCSARLSDRTLFKHVQVESKELDDITNEINNQIINSVIIYLENLDVYPDVSIPAKERVQIFYEFLKDSCTSRFLKKILLVIEENDKNEEREEDKQLNKFFSPIVDLIFENLIGRNLVYPKNDVAVLLKFLSSFKQIAEVRDCALSRVDNAEGGDSVTSTTNAGFDAQKPCSKDKEINSCGYNLQLSSLLGRLLSPTVITMPNVTNKEEIAMYKYFYNSATNSLNKMTLGSLKNTYMMLRRDTDWILENCVETIKNLLKGGVDSKKRVLLWLACIIISNEKKTKIMYHYSTYPQSLDASYGLFLKLLGENSYGFCLNMFWVLLCLCEPITMNKINDFDLFFFLRDDPFSKFLLKNITNQSSFEEKSNVEKIKEKVKNGQCFQKEPKFITSIFWITFKSLSVFFKPAIDEFIRIVQEVPNAKDKNFYYMNIHTWKIFLYSSRFIQLLFKFLHLSIAYFLHVAYLYDMEGNACLDMMNLLSEYNGNFTHLVLKSCPPPNERNYIRRGRTFGSLSISANVHEGEEPQQGVEKRDEEGRRAELPQGEADQRGELPQGEVDQRAELPQDEVGQREDGAQGQRGSDNLERSPQDSGDHLFASPQFSIIPTFFLNDIFDIIYLLYELDTFKSPGNENFLSYLNVDLFLSFCIFTMLSENHIKSIHLRCEAAPKTFTYLYRSDKMKKIIEESDLTRKYIIKSLTYVFIASQKGEYTERMQTRVRIVENFNSLFLNEIYVDQFTQLVIKNNNLFVHLIHLLLNDVNFLVEEVVSYLSEIKRREDKKRDDQERAGSAAGGGTSAGGGSNTYANATRNSRVSSAFASSMLNPSGGSDLEDSAANLNESYNSDNSDNDEGGGGNVGTDITNESMRNLAARTKMIITYCYKSCIFLNLLCKSYPNSIVTSNTILSQIVTCLNCYFDYLVGPKCLNIKVKNMEQYNFRPQLWLTSIVESYLFLLNSDKKNEELLTREIANEGRYYKPEIFNKAYYICKREGLLRKEDLHKFKIFCQQIIDMKDEVELFDDVDDIPDKYLDPILQDIMLDPVLLPTSGIVIDRKNIERHLMSEPNDPFNRAPLSKEQLVPMPELKEEIHKFINELKQEKKRKKKMKLLELDAQNESLEKEEFLGNEDDAQEGKGQSEQQVEALHEGGTKENEQE